jgi:hypothetical protein
MCVNGKVSQCIPSKITKINKCSKWKKFQLNNKMPLKIGVLCGGSILCVSKGSRVNIETDILYDEEYV